MHHARRAGARLREPEVLVEHMRGGRNELPPSATTWAVGLSRNGDMYECFLCNARYRTLAQLNQHSKSPSHEDKIHRRLKTDCKIEFSTLSELCRHVEGGSCGVRMFRRVRDRMESLTRRFKLAMVDFELQTQNATIHLPKFWSLRIKEKSFIRLEPSLR
jgi:hypothetical protein